MINNLYILLDDLVCSMAEHFYKLCPFFLTSPQGKSIYKQPGKVLSDTTHLNIQ